MECINVQDIKNPVVNNRGLFINDEKKYVILRNVHIKFTGDNSRFEKNSNKIRQYVKATSDDINILNDISNQLNCDNKCINDDLITIYINDQTTVYDSNRNKLKYKLRDLIDCDVDMVVHMYTITNSFGKYERIAAKQIKIVKKNFNLLDNCCL